MGFKIAAILASTTFFMHILSNNYSQTVTIMASFVFVFNLLSLWLLTVKKD